MSRYLRGSIVEESMRYDVVKPKMCEFYNVTFMLA